MNKELENPKTEYRNPKQAENSDFQNSKKFSTFKFLSFEFVSNFGFRASSLIFLLFAIFYLLFAPLSAEAGPVSGNFELKEYGFGSGGIATSSSTNFMFQGIAGEIETASLSSTNFRLGPGLTYMLEPNVPPAPTLTNPSNYYNKLKIVIGTGGNPTDTTYTIAVTNTSSNFATLAQDSFTGTNGTSLTSHTPDIGGSWVSHAGSGGNMTIFSNNVISNNPAGNKEYTVGSLTLGDGDLYVTDIDPLNSGSSMRLMARRVTTAGTRTYYYATYNSIVRVTANSPTTVASFTYTGGFPARVHFQVSGSSPTTLRLRSWTASSSEPTSWNIDTTENTGGNQMTSGWFGINSFAATDLKQQGDDFLVTSGGSQTSSLYVQADGTLGSTPVFQTYTSWGGASPGTTIVGLTPGVTYYARVAARRGTFQQGAFSAIASAATVNPTLTFSLQTTNQSVPPFTVGIGTVNAGQVTTSWQKVTTTMSTNANNGGVIYLNDVSGGLVSATASNYKINSVTAQNDLSGLLEGYGARGVSVSGAPMQFAFPYNGSGNTVGIIDASKRVFADSAQTPVTNGSASFELQAKASTTTPAATDYADIITVVATGSF